MKVNITLVLLALVLFLCGSYLFNYISAWIGVVFFGGAGFSLLYALYRFIIDD